MIQRLRPALIDTCGALDKAIPIMGQKVDVVELKRRCEESRDQGAAAMNGHHNADEVAGPADAG